MGISRRSIFGLPLAVLAPGSSERDILMRAADEASHQLRIQREIQRERGALVHSLIELFGARWYFELYGKVVVPKVDGQSPIKVPPLGFWIERWKEASDRGSKMWGDL